MVGINMDMPKDCSVCRFAVGGMTVTHRGDLPPHVSLECKLAGDIVMTEIVRWRGCPLIEIEE